MTPLSIQPPYPIFAEADGQPLEDGYIWVGVANLNPITNPITVYWDAALTIPAAQPIRTQGGYPVNSGTPARFFNDSENYSILVMDKKGSVIYSSLSNVFTVQKKVTLKDYGAVGDGTSHPLSQFFATLAEAQAIYPFVTSLSQEIDWAAAQLSLNTNGIAYASEGTYFITEEVDVPDNAYIYGDGQGLSTLLFHKDSNPASSEFMLAMRSRSNVLIEKLTIKSNAYDDGLFDVGTYDPGPPKRYIGGDAGNINGVLISSCSNITVQNCEITGFNYDGIRVSVEGNNPATHYNYNLKFDKLYGHHCLVTPLDILGTIGYSVTNCTMTDNGNYTAQYIDGSTGYGIVLGRTAGANQLPARDGICSDNYCARNVRHGIDAHSAVDILINNNVCEDNLAMGIGVLDYSGSADDKTGAAVVQNNLIKHTVWVVSQYPLLTYRNDGSERDDSLGIYVSGFSNLVIDAIVQNNTIIDLRYKQLVANTATDIVGAIFCSASASAIVRGNYVEAFQTNYYPSICLDINAPRIEVTDNHFRGYQRSTISKEYFRFAASGGSGVGLINGNYFEAIGQYSDSAGTQAAYPLFRNASVGASLTFTGNAIVQTAQGVRGAIWQSAFTNQQWGFNGILSQNSGNTLKVAGTTTMEYASAIKGSLAIYISSTGAGRYDGFSSGNAFVCTSGTTLQQIINDMPRCESGLTINIIDQVSLGATAGVTIPDWQDNITFAGNSADNTNSMTKTAGFTHTGGTAFMIGCPERASNINFQYLYLGSNTFGAVVSRPSKVLYCGVECTNAGAYALNFEFRQGYVRNTRFKGGTAGVVSGLASAVVSQLNDSDATRPAYGLYANSGAIYKNSTQPTGSTANELTQNGGTIA